MQKILCLIAGLFSLFAFSQELPPVTNFSPNEYAAGNQNWMISRGKDDNFYFANGNGLLEFNGERWKIYPVPNNSIVRAVKLFEDRIYTGAYMEAGFWTRNDVGTLQYHSIINEFPKGVKDGELFWDIQTLEGIIIFRSFSGIYFYDPVNETVTEFDIPEGKAVSGLFKLHNNIYFQLVGGGLYVIKKGHSEEVIPAHILKDVTIKYLYGKTGELRLITGHSGFFVWNGNSLNEFNKSLSQEIGYTNIFTAVDLPNGDLVLGTVGKGIVQVDSEGKILYKYNQENILLNNTTLSLYVDDGGNIWAGLDYGISKINLNSSFHSFRDVKGKIGSVYTSFLNASGDLYLGTNQGLYLKKKNADDFSLITGTNGQVWSLNEIDGYLFCGHDTGTFLIKGNTATKISDRLGTWFIKKIKENVYVQGHYYGFSFIKKSGDQFVSLPLVKDFQHSSRNIEVDSDSVLWVNNEHRGVFKIKYDVDSNKIEKLQNFQFSDSIWATSSMFKFADTLYYSTKRKIYQYDEATKKFTEKNRLNELVAQIDRISGKMVDNDQKLWGFADKYIFYLKQSAITGDYEIKRFYIDQSYRNIADGYENVSLLNNEEYLLGVANGYLLFREQQEKPKTYEVNINSIRYSALDKKPEKAVLDKAGNFDFQHNNISFQYAVPVYNKYVKALYSYRLKGQSSRWSEWSENSEANFKNLDFGDYTFEVRSKIANIVTPAASYAFVIGRPFYLSSLALLGYVLIFILFLTGIHMVNKRHHNKVLIEKEKNLKMKNLEAEQKIIKLQNDHLERDVAEKNRELAVSTMSLIKKNEFLTSIKEKLKESDSTKVKAVIKTIDRDISEGGNWKFFKEAFNNADKDFFNKIKKAHPELTSNDLKLCAYLRLNLSSKEIAPLLNISVKSVEIKRYRLRKKMNLDRNINLTDYILGI